MAAENPISRIPPVTSPSYAIERSNSQQKRGQQQPAFTLEKEEGKKEQEANQAGVDVDAQETATELELEVAPPKEDESGSHLDFTA